MLLKHNFCKKTANGLNICIIVYKIRTRSDRTDINVLLKSFILQFKFENVLWLQMTVTLDEIGIKNREILNANAGFKFVQFDRT